VRLVLAGDGPLREMLEALGRQTGGADFVHFVGFHHDVQPVLDALDVFVLPSLSEALPYALMEAMAGGLPCVASDVGGVPEIVAAGETGFLAAPADAPSLAGALSPLLRSKELARQNGARGPAADYFSIPLAGHGGPDPGSLRGRLECRRFESPDAKPP